MPRFSKQRDFRSFYAEQYVPDYEDVVIFDSRFENGNLRKAAKITENEYNLWLENDTNTRGHTQWYFFKVAYRDVKLPEDNVRARIQNQHRVKFNVMNLAKSASLYEQGMQPCIWSRRRSEQDGTGWFRGGDAISYSPNGIPRTYQVSYAGDG
jgi:cytosolic carboxypeptidase protein 2/3